MRIWVMFEYKNFYEQYLENVDISNETIQTTATMFRRQEKSHNASSCSVGQILF